METPSPQPSLGLRSTIRRFFRWLFSWPTIRRTLIGFACLLTLIALAYTVENWRGKRAWMQFKNRMEAKGEHFDLASIVPKPVPEEQNFAMTPLLKPLLDYTITNGIVWHDEAGIRRAGAVDVQIAMPEELEQMFRKRYGLTKPITEPVSVKPGVPRETNAPKRVSLPPRGAVIAAPEMAGMGAMPQGPPPAANTQPPKLGLWAAGKHTDLRAWQAFYHGNTNYPAHTQPGTPAADVLAALSKYSAQLAELRAAAARPYSVFPVKYEAGPQVLLRHLTVLRKMAYLPALRATALLELGRSDEALGDVQLALSLEESVKEEPIMISQLVRIAILQAALQPVWEGLSEGRWNDAQLASLQSRLQRLHLLEGYPLAIRGENVIFIGQTVDRLCSGVYHLSAIYGGPVRGEGLWPVSTLLFPDGWCYQNHLVCSRLLLEHFLPVVDLERQCADPGAAQAADETLGRLVARRTPYNLLASIMLPACGKLALRIAYAQCSGDLAVVACALERCRFAHGQYPESLDALTPQFIEKLPHDVITCQPLKYRRTDDGRFMLYSVGWNQADDGGTVILNKSGQSVDTTQGDWVWRYPTE